MYLTPPRCGLACSGHVALRCRGAEVGRKAGVSWDALVSPLLLFSETT